VAFLVFTYFVSPITMDAVDLVLKCVEKSNWVEEVLKRF